MIIPHCLFPKIFPKDINNPYNKRTCIWLRLLPICGMLGDIVCWDVRDVECSGCGLFGMWDVRDVWCSGCGMFGMWDVFWDVGCWFTTCHKWETTNNLNTKRWKFKIYPWIFYLYGCPFKKYIQIILTIPKLSFWRSFKTTPQNYSVIQYSTDDRNVNFHISLHYWRRIFCYLQFLGVS